MPTENELKFVLSSENILLEDSFRENTSKNVLIEQVYLVSEKGKSLRLRKAISKKGEHQEITFKCDVPGRVIELNYQLSKKDFDDLWNIGEIKVIKNRYITHCAENEVWAIDFFKGHNMAIFFVMAEVEMLPNATFSGVMPPLVSQNLLFAVSKEDHRFASKRIANVHYATDLYNRIKKERK